MKNKKIIIIVFIFFIVIIGAILLNIKNSENIETENTMINTTNNDIGYSSEEIEI